MSGYHDLYLKTLLADVLLLADTFEKFINTCLEYYGLDPCHYFSSPTLNWDAMLEMTEKELELISDTDMYLFIEKGIRRGISYITKRFIKAKNKYMQLYDDKKPRKYVTYLDANNLYGWAMSQYWLYGEFKWLIKKEIDKFDVNSTEYNSIEENSSKGYILEVDLEYPDELHELYKDYPLAPEKPEISYDMLSNYCSNIANKYEIKIGGVNKLLPNLGNKSKYILHCRSLQLYLSLRIKLVSIEF